MAATPPKSQTYRPAFIPSLIAAAALLSGIPLLEADWYLLIRFIVAIMATVFGLGGMAATSAGVVQLLALMLTAFFAISLVAGFYRRAR